jgi:acetolactate synthase small subunit
MTQAKNGMPIPTRLTKAPHPTQEQTLCRLTASVARIEAYLEALARQIERLVDLIVAVKAEDDQLTARLEAQAAAREARDGTP